MAELIPINIYLFHENKILERWERSVTELWVLPSKISAVYRDAEGTTRFIYECADYSTPLSLHEVMRFRNNHAEKVQIIYSLS